MDSRWDIFCKVVDNFGDAGVTWRLARQLANEQGLAVRLWIDDLTAFARLCPDADPLARTQVRAGVQVCQWPEPWEDTPTATVVIEAFGCKLPGPYQARLAATATPALWVNLDYLSAETWVGGCHGLPSLGCGSVRKFFFFPGFRSDTGGLLREAGLLERRDAFQASRAARDAFLRGLNVSPAPEARLLSLFAYENDGLTGWLEALAAAPRLTHLLVPEGRVLANLETWAQARVGAGDCIRRGGLTVQVVPFVSQEAYDQLLWACDFNAVRGEDSFVRAQWAARPMLWHIYRQDEYAHWEKLEAFLELYTEGLPGAASEALRGLWRSWNMDGDMASAWAAVEPHWDELQSHARQWCAGLAARPDLATALVQFCRNSL
ncbi:elongation factor P maturation arginine rhamnosyltransferase EarP [Pseudomonas sp. RIT-PI-S]|uniref:elongation factor P maturation arginine rhamnosyltransferase EarP n=1 Tax=Pseudomonas sp. RIT-PI-S TaxID=3035295 RepID=UPI0021D8CB25|nr:elongation factor P maturation arginine rhamnosyltransferase EarP [Pseudomonas sp. RIT-PI-S]